MKDYFKQQSDELKHQLDQAEAAMDAAAYLDALINLLTEKGVIDTNEYQDHVQKVKALPIYKQAYEGIAEQRKQIDKIDNLTLEDALNWMKSYGDKT